MDDAPTDLVCLSHLWWDSVWQRPQHLLSRLARHYPVLWVEEPHIEIGPPSDSFEVTEERPNLSVGRLVYRADAPTFWQQLRATLDRTGAERFILPEDLREASLLFGSPAQDRLEREVCAYVASRRRGRLVLWLYTPAVVRFIDLLQPELVVYDVMDDLRAFKYAPPELARQEEELLARSDLVFAGGPSLHDAIKARRPDVHLFPSGVEQQHFAQARRDDLALPPPISALPHPVVGFFGVIDERIDLALLAEAAAARPAWSWVLIGPVVKIEERTLPRLPNLHYLGKQDYQDLPAYLKAFDVAMMPFALNEATRSISPTKTLEYMAAGKPIVSTAIRDVVALYGGVVRIAEGPDSFAAAVEAALDEGPREREQRVRQERALLRRSAWDRVAGEMDALIRHGLAQKGVEPEAR